MPRTAALLLVFVFARATSAFAQFETAALVGTVVDSSGGAVADAVITATNVETGVAQTRTTDARGGYEFVTLRIGTYVVTAERAGFAISVADNVRLAVGTTASDESRTVPTTVAVSNWADAFVAVSSSRETQTSSGLIDDTS